MNADEMYEGMKDALYFFGLKFHDKHLVTVTVSKGKLHFTYEGRTVSYDV